MQRHNIIVIADEPWENFTWRRRHHVAWAVAKAHKVLFVEPPYSLLSPLRDRNINWKQVFNLGRLKHQGRNLYSYSPAKVLPEAGPLSKVLCSGDLIRKAALAGVKRALQRLEMQEAILWVFYSSQQYDYYGLLGERVVVGDIYDKFGASTWDGMPTAESRMLEEKQEVLLRNCDVVFTVSRELQRELISRHPHVHLIANGVDCDSFASRIPSRSVSGVKGLKGPVLAFLGMLHYKVDFELLDYIADRHPEWTILLIGKNNIHSTRDRRVFAALKRRTNVRWLGEVERNVIPHLLGKADVCLVPLRKLEMNRYANFLKIWEYLAAGKPIVAVDQGVEFEYPGLIRLAGSREEFARAISLSLKMDSGQDSATRRRQVAEAHSWENQVKKMLEIVEATIADRDAARIHG